MGAGRPRLPARGWAGLALVATCWAGNWLVTGLRTHLLFFPLWLGAVLLLDALVERRSGTSPLRRSPRGFAALFVVSVPLWWLFEAANLRLRNWEYVGREHFGTASYALLCSLSFSTVVPAVLLAAEWFRGMPWIERRGPWVRVTDSRGLRATLLVLGLVTAGLWLAFPRTCYPLVWVSGVFLLEPLLLARGRRGLVTDLARGDWRPWLALWCGGLLCGFLWELWNARSYPKWIYDTPGVGAPYLFEMPLLGYLGYLPFALVVYQWKELWPPRPELLGPSASKGGVIPP